MNQPPTVPRASMLAAMWKMPDSREPQPVLDIQKSLFPHVRFCVFSAKRRSGGLAVDSIANHAFFPNFRHWAWQNRPLIAKKMAARASRQFLRAEASQRNSGARSAFAGIRQNEASILQGAGHGFNKSFLPGSLTAN